MTKRVLFLIGSLLALAAPARAEVEVQAGLHVGFVFGHGWVLGPTLGVGWPIVRANLFSQVWSMSLTGGLAAAGDVSFDAGGHPAFRVHVGPELAAFQSCPAFVVPVGVGLAWSFERARPPDFGWGGHLGFLLAALHPTPDYLHPAPGPTFLFGPSYRWVMLSPGHTAHEIGADAGFVFLPGGGGLGYCGGD